MGHVRASGSASLGHRGLGQLDSAIMRSARTDRAIPRLPFQGNETPGSVANDLRLPAVGREPHRQPRCVPLTSPDHLRAAQLDAG